MRLGNLAFLPALSVVSAVVYAGSASNEVENGAVGANPEPWPDRRAVFPSAA
jgi:hypothetical protein